MNTGDLEPDWIVDIAAEVGTDFTTVQSWRFDAWYWSGNGKVEAFTDSDPDITPGAAVYQVTVSHPWAAGETDAARILHGVPVATWPGGREQSFPGATIEITADPS